MSWGNDVGSEEEPEDVSLGSGPEDGARMHPFWDGSVRIFDPEGFNRTWSGARPGADYVRGTREAERVAAAVDELYSFLEHRSPLDYMQPTTDIDGNPFVTVGLSAAGMGGVVVLVREALIARGVLVGEAG